MTRSLAWLMAVGLMGAGCAEDVNLGLLIAGNNPLGTGCVITSPGEVFLTRGTVDVLLTDQYQMSSVVTNRLQGTVMQQSRSTGDMRVEANIVTLQSAAITYQFPEGPEFGDVGQLIGGNSHQEFITGRLHPAKDASGPGDSLVVSIPLLAPGLAGVISDKLPVRDAANPAPVVTLLAKIKVTGTTLDGSAVTSGAFDYPVDMCKGCLLFFPIEAKLGEGNPNCRNEANPPDERPCRLGQDDPVDCRICREVKPIALRNECEPF